MDTKQKAASRIKRKKRIRKKITGTMDRPRLCVYKSLKNIYAQLIDDQNQKVLTGASSLSKELAADIKYGGNIESAKKVGQFIGRKALEMGLQEVLFDRNGFKYHGRVKALADGAREAGLVF
ncbi:MAG TPA: 50S ribosomal protein L18 [Deltaproteobacteria bacterium]|nr:50S ribosomal protein L18 [Deltaproteobacteria bacterium]